MFKKIDLQKEFVIKFNWIYALSFVFFWCYSIEFYGKVSSFGRTLSHALPFLFIFIFLLLLAKNEKFQDEIKFQIKDIFLFSGYSLFLGIFSFPTLTYPLTGDQLYHSQSALSSSINIAEKLFLNLPAFDLIPCRLIIWALNVLLLIALGLIFNISKRLSNTWRIVFLTIVFGIGLILPFGSDGHPPFRLFPLWISSTIFSPTDFAFRFASFIALIVFTVILQKILNKTLPQSQSVLAALAISSIPVLWHAGTIVEPSIWTTIIFTLVLFKLFDRTKINYFRWIAIISIFSLMRSTAFLAFVPLGARFLIDVHNKDEALDWRKILYYLIPVSICVSYVFAGIKSGSPATYYDGCAGFIPAGSNILQRTIIAFYMGVVKTAFLNNFSLIWIFMFPFAFIPFKKDEIIKKVIAFLFFMIAFVMFYGGIRPVLWGLGRYQTEYVLPFIALGFFNLLNFFNAGKPKAIQWITNLILLFIIIFNVNSFINLPKLNANLEQNVDYNSEHPPLVKIISETFYDYSSAYAKLKKESLGANAYIAGITYGGLGYIINDFSCNDYKNVIKIHKEQQRMDFSEIDKNKNVKVVLISDAPKKELLKQFKTNKGWKRWHDFYDKDYKTVIQGFIRN